MKKLLTGLSLTLLCLTGCSTSETMDTLDKVSDAVDKVQQISDTKSNSNQTFSNSEYDKVVYFDEEKYPETAEHIKNAIAKGESKVCTIDRDGSDENREQSLKGVPTKKGYDRDEWPMAMCEEGGKGADIMYISPSDNRGAGSWVSHQLSNYPDGTKVLFVVE